MTFSRKLIQQSRILFDLAKNPVIDDGPLSAAFGAITEACAAGVESARASIWLYNEGKDAIVCHDLYQAKIGKHESGLVLKQADFPTYFKYLREERVLVANDAHADPSTFEFSSNYLRPLGINSMLDAPVRRRGKTVGVICCEHVGPPIHWSVEQEGFAGSIADLVARALEAHDRHTAQRQLMELNQHLERLVRDRTLELELERARSLHSAKMASLGEMAGGIAHEINNPVAIIHMLAGQIQELPDEEFCRSTVVPLGKKIEETSLRISKIIKGLRNIARDSSEDPMLPSKIDKVIEDAVGLCGEKFKHKGVKLMVDSRPDLSVKGRPVQLAQVILNLLANAFDAICEKRDPWISITLATTGRFLEIRITDSGNGIPPESRDKLYQPFFTTKPVGKGTGLGLPISKSIIEAHGGCLELDADSPNTTFVVRLPALIEENAA